MTLLSIFLNFTSKIFYETISKKSNHEGMTWVTFFTDVYPTIVGEGELADFLPLTEFLIKHQFRCTASGTRHGRLLPCPIYPLQV